MCEGMESGHIQVSLSGDQHCTNSQSAASPIVSGISTQPCERNTASSVPTILQARKLVCGKQVVKSTGVVVGPSWVTNLALHLASCVNT